MEEVKSDLAIIEEKIIQKIILLRDEKVILDIHLAELYGVETRALKQAVKRNLERFPGQDFMFELSEDEIDAVVSQNVIPHRKNLGGSIPFAFTETGVAMLSSILRSPTAIRMNIAIMRTFVALRKVSHNYQDIILSEMRMQYDSQFKEFYAALDSLVNPPSQPRPRIGFRRKDEQD
jgi:hypothetical protein